MSLREFMAWWLRGLRGLRVTAVNLDEAVTQRRLHARDDDELARDIAELRALQSAHEPVLVPVPLMVSLEALWARPTVTPDLRGHTFVRAANDLAVADWLRFQWPEAWWKTDWEKVREVADKLLVLREAQIAGMVEL